MNIAMESAPLLPVELSEKPQWKTSTKLGLIGLVLAATAAVSAYSQPKALSVEAKSSLSTSTTTSTTSTNTHVVFILVDDMGMNDIGYKSSDLSAMTPELDQLAAKGIKLEKYYSMQLCTPARSALLTAKLPLKLGMQYENIHPDMPWGLSTDEKIMPQYFRSAGYRCYLVGKWNQGHYKTEYHPTSRGFDSFTGYLSDEVNYYTHEYPSPFGDQSYQDFSEGTEKDGLSGLSKDLAGTYTMEIYTDRIKSLISAHTTETGEFAERPMFLYYAAQSVHGPLDAPPLSILEDSALANLNNLGYVDGEHRQVFAAILASFDTSVTEIRTAMEAANMWQDTLLIVASDNGGCSEEGGSNSPLRGGKHWMFEGGVHVPAFIYSANTDILSASVAGSTYNDLFHVTDWLPTIMSAISAPEEARPSVAKNDIDGYDHWTAITQQTTSASSSTSTTEFVEKTESVRDHILIHLSSWTSCCESQSGESACTGFLSSCADSDSAVLTFMDTPRGAIVSSSGYKLILNEYEIPWFGVSTTSSPDVTSDVKMFPLTDGAASLLAEMDIVDSKDSTGNPMSNCGSKPNTANTYWLFDLKADPTETTNLYGTLPDVEAELLDKFNNYLLKEVRANWVNVDSTAYKTWKANDGVITSWL